MLTGICYGAGYYIVGILFIDWVEDYEGVGGSGPINNLILKTLWPVLLILWVAGYIYRGIAWCLRLLKNVTRHKK